MPFTALLCSSIYFGFLSFQQQQLDVAVQQAARRILIESVDVPNGRNFLRQYICPNTPAGIDCEKLEIGALVYNGDPASLDPSRSVGRWCLGEASDNVLLVLRYPTAQAFAGLSRLLTGRRSEAPVLLSHYSIRREPTATAGDGDCT